MSTTQLLFELGTEELPAGQLVTMADALNNGICAGLRQRGLAYESAHWFATPRRLAVLVDGLSTQAPDSEQQVLGPPAANARDSEGNWTPAAQGFAKKQGIEPDALEIIDTDKGPRLGLNKVERGAHAADVVAEIIADAVAAIPVSKRMRWGRSRHEFLRPVQWLVALLDDQIVPLSLFGLESGRDSRGHRFHHSGTVTLTKAGEYSEAMSRAHVMADFQYRREVIRDQVNAIALAEGAKAVIDEALLDEVTGLVEWPVALKGSFDAAFLDVPAEALISSMKEHQKYFHLTDHNERLLPLFITVANIDSRNPALVVSGNEKVIRPRLSDAAFFFETDKKTALVDRAERLSGVVFQQKLGTLADKTARVGQLAGWLAEHIGADKATSERAALLAKCDLVSDMVLEFPELQGIAGAHYARNDGEPEAVAAAIEQHYWPRFAGDNLPESREAMAVALADRLDTMAGIFGIGQTPTGSKDPFALRRASVAVIRLLIALDTDLDLLTLATQAASAFPAGALSEGAAQAVTDYTLERLRAWYEDQQIGVDVLRAVLETGLTNPAEIDRRVHAVYQFAQQDSAVALAAANKRVANILAKSETGTEQSVDASLLSESAEQQLFESLTGLESSLQAQIADKDYTAALETLARLREPVDAFFEQVMVNADDPALRRNRHALLARLRAAFIGIADIAQLTPKD